MGSGKILLFAFLMILIHFANMITAQAPGFIRSSCTDSANYTTNSTYQTNLETVLSSIAFHTSSNYGFYNTSAGQGLDTVNAIALCSGDVSRRLCRECVSVATSQIREVCPNQKEAFGASQSCMLRYSNANIFHRVWPLRERDTFTWWNENNVSSIDEFNQALTALATRLQAEAAAGGSLRKYAAENITGPDSQEIYSTMQCTPDLSEAQCNNCLSVARTQMQICCNGSIGGRVILPSCSFRYEPGSFYDDPPEIQLPSPSPPPQGHNLPIILGVAIPLSLVICGSVLFYIWRRKLLQRGNNGVNLMLLDFDISSKAKSTTESEEVLELPMFSFSSISAATQNFSESNKLGEGGFGPVYKGNLLNGQAVAVKRLSRKSEQGLEELRNETILIAKLQHKNLVRVLGGCIERDEKILIYEYMPNKSLDTFLFDPKKQELDWSMRVCIIEGIAQGLLYLHHYSRLRIVHRDLKASNILLDADMNPKISDFGMARIFGGKDLQANTNRIVGTYGYMSPEYAMEGRFSVKSDVFAFGVLLLEILSGKKNTSFFHSDCCSLLGYAWKLWKNERVLELIDPILQNPPSCTALRYIHIGLLCVQESPADRPTMSEVLAMISNENAALDSPKQPGFTPGTNPNTSSSGVEICSHNGVTVSLLKAR